MVDSGFDPIVFAEPDTDVDGLECPVVMRPNTIAEPVFGQITGIFGCWRNYVQTLADLLESDPDADAIMVVQDDAVFCRGLREFLDHDLWPGPDSGMVSLWCPTCPPDHKYGHYFDPGHRGLRRISARYLVGVVASVYPRYVVEHLLKHQTVLSWKGDVGPVPLPVEGRKAVDAMAGNALAQMRLSVHYYNPSLVEHYSPGPDHNNSTLGHGSNAGFRTAAEFVGYETDAVEVFTDRYPWVRYDEHGDQRFGPRGPESKEPLSIIIPGRGCEDLTELCLWHIVRHTECDVRVIYVADGDESADKVLAHSPPSLPVQAVVRKAQGGFTPAVNAGLKRADGHALILNNDCFVGPACIDKLKKHLEWHPRVGATSPLTADGGCQSVTKHSSLARDAECGTIDDPSDAKEGAFKCQRVWVQPRQMLVFFCCLLHKDALADVGDLDPELPSGLGADDDWCVRARRKNWKMLLVYEAFAAHLHSQTFKRLKLPRKKWQGEAMRYLKKKGVV